MSHLVFDPLVRWSSDFRLQPRLARQWRQIDARTLRFYLRDGVVFHSGRALSSADVRWTLQRLQTSPDFKALFAPVERVEIVDRLTFDVITRAPYPLLLNVMTYVFPMDRRFYSGTDSQGRPKDVLIKHGDSFAATHASGTGPFRVTYREQGVRMEFSRFERYWDPDTGNVEKIVLTPIKKGPTRVAALLSGDVDFIAPVPPNDFPRLQRSASVKLITMPGTRIILLQLNQQRRPEFRDVRVRQAIVHAVNNRAIVAKIMKGFGVAAGQLSPAGYPGHVPELVPRYDLGKARRLMAEAGYSQGFTVTMMAPNNRYVNDEKIAQAVAAMLARIGIKVHLKTLPKAQYWPEFDRRAADMMMIGWHADTEDSANFSEFLVACPDPDTGWGQYNSGGYCNRRVDDLLRQAAGQTEPAQRARLLQEIEKILYRDAAFVPLHWQNLAWAAKRSLAVEGVVNVMNFPYLGDLTM